jgi:hypothetical protein
MGKKSVCQKGTRPTARNVATPRLSANHVEWGSMKLGLGHLPKFARKRRLPNKSVRKDGAGEGIGDEFGKVPGEPGSHFSWSCGPH